MTLAGARAALVAVTATWLATDAVGQPAAPLDISLKAASCNACHGPYGRSEAGIPPLAGRSAKELSAALVGFKTGSRPAYVMQQHAKGYRDDELVAIAEYFAAQPPERVRK
jgi:sulfide dehydrogenase cytochrome subunit